MTAVACGYSRTTCARMSALHARADPRRVCRHLRGLSEQRAHQVHHVHAVLQQHAALARDLEGLGRFVRIVLLEPHEPPGPSTPRRYCSTTAWNHGRYRWFSCT